MIAMCTKSKERKYQYYDIKVISNLDGSTENISMLNEEKVDKSNYKQMLEVYRDIKEQYKNENVTIDFMGVADDSTIKVMWNKEYSLYNKKETIFDICDELNEVVQKFRINKEESQNLQGAYDKKEDKQLHKLDHLKKKNEYELTEKEKSDLLKLVINLQAIRADRRDNKNEQGLICSLNDVDALTKLFSLNDIIQNKKNKLIAKNNNFKQAYQDNKVDESKMYKEVYYKNHKDRIGIMKELQKQFKKITYDEKKHVCIGYNTIY